MPEQAMPFYHAVLNCSAVIRLIDLDKLLPSIVLDTGESHLQVRASKKLRKYLLTHTPPTTQRFPVILYPRTDQDGRLLRLSLIHYLMLSPAKVSKPFEEGLAALGELVFIDKEQALIGLKIWPNLQGYLDKPFILSLMMSLADMEHLPALGSGIRVKASLKPRSLRFLVTDLEEVVLPPKKVFPGKADPSKNVKKSEAKQG